MATKPVLILMAGLRCTGKTTLASALGDALHCPVMNKDLIKIALMEMGLEMPEELAGRIAYDLLFALTKNFLVNQHLSIIFDTGAHKPFILEHVLPITRAAGVEMYIILCTVSEELRRERIAHRVTSMIYPPFMTQIETTTIDDDDQNFRHLPINRLITIDTNDSLEKCRDKALHFLL